MKRVRGSSLRAIPALGPHMVRAMPWGTLLAGCTAGTVLLDVMAHVLRSSHGAADQQTLRLTFLTVVAALAFVPKAPFRPINHAVPAPAWIFTVGQVVLATPVVAITCWLQLRIIDAGVPGAHRPPIYPLLAQLGAWSTAAIATAACIDRTRYADLGGAVAAPVTFVLIAAAWYAPFLKTQFVTPPATAGHATIAWYAVLAASLGAMSLALADRWRRYLKQGHLRSV
jgi:hypothetical protein